MFKILVSVVFLIFLIPSAFSRSPWPAAKTVSNIPLLGFESSGTVYDPSTNLIYVVDDQGSIASMTIDGKQLRYVKVRKGLDMEAVATTGNGSGYIYVGIERRKTCYFDIRSIIICNKKRAQIWELDVKTLQPTNRVWVLDMKTGFSKGLEGLTWVPNGSHPYGIKSSGGVFYSSSQKNGHIYVYDIDMNIKPNTTYRIVKHIDKFQPFSGYFNNDISDLYFDPAQKILYALYGDKHKLVEIDISSTAHRVLASYNLPGRRGNNEGVTLLPSCRSGETSTKIYLTDDRKGKGLYSYNTFPVTCSNIESLASLNKTKDNQLND